MNKGADLASYGKLCGCILAVAAFLNMQPTRAQEDPSQAPIKIQIHGAIEEPIPTLITIHGAIEERPHIVMKWSGVARDISQIGLNMLQGYWILRNQRINTP